MKILTRAASETKRLGRVFAGVLAAGDVVALEGELGAGKTTLVKGIAKGLGVPNEKQVSSPTFVLIHEYKGRFKIFHLDWYRLKSVAGPDADMARDCFEEDALTLVEWPEKGRRVLPKDALRVRIAHEGGDKRSFRFKLPAKRAALLKKAWKA